MKIISSKIAGFGHYVPPQCIDNSFFEEKFQFPDGWIEKRTGIKKRHWVHNEDLITIAQKAGALALQNSSLSKKNIALTILATSTPDHLLPPTAPLLAEQLNLQNSGAFDLAGACSGFIYALTLADSFVRIHNKAVLIVAANILSRRINMSDYKSAILFGDAAGSIVLAPSLHDHKEKNAQGILGVSFMSQGKDYDLISIPAGGNKTPFSPEIPLEDYKMCMKNGKSIFHQAVKMMIQCSNAALKYAKLDSSNLNRFVPHQANMRMIQSVAKQLQIADHKIVNTISDYGNSSAASIPVSLSVTNESKPFVPGEKILLAAAGAGMTGGAVVFSI